MRIQAGGLQLNYETYGDVGDWLVMCHGLGAGLQSMREVAKRFSDGYRVLSGTTAVSATPTMRPTVTTPSRLTRATSRT
jgi:hypothetical protein